MQISCILNSNSTEKLYLKLKCTESNARLFILWSLSLSSWTYNWNLKQLTCCYRRPSLLCIRFLSTQCERTFNPCHIGVNTGWVILYCNVTLSIHHPSRHPRKTGAQVTPECDIKGYVCIQITTLFVTYLKVEGSGIYIIYLSLYIKAYRK